MQKIKAYSDGACKGNPGPGGWGVIVYDENTEWMTYNGKKKTTNQEMELQAMNEALRICQFGNDIELFSDSMYVLQGLVQGGKKGVLDRKENGKVWFTGWVGAWRAKGWVKSDGGAIKHLDLWKSIVNRCEDHMANGSKLTFTWVKGHSHDKGNDMADKLANLGIGKL